MTLRATAFNVGMISENHFKKKQGAKVAELAGWVESWLAKDLGPAAVGLNEIHKTIADKLEQVLLQRKVSVQKLTHETNSVLWRTP